MPINRIRAEKMPRFLVNLSRGPVLPKRQELGVAAPRAEFVDFPQTSEDLSDDYQYIVGKNPSYSYREFGVGYTHIYFVGLYVGV